MQGSSARESDMQRSYYLQLRCNVRATGRKAVRERGTGTTEVSNMGCNHRYYAARLSMRALILVRRFKILPPVVTLGASQLTCEAASFPGAASTRNTVDVHM